VTQGEPPPLLQAELKELQCEIRAATFVAVRAAEEQSAALKKLMDQSRVDSTKTQEMLAQVTGNGDPNTALLQNWSARPYIWPTQKHC